MEIYEMRIAIVNDMRMAVEALRRTVSSVPEYQIAWIATNGEEAVSKCASDTPDLILMDLLMPVMDGVEATRRIMRESPCAILVVTATVRGNASKVFDALGCGALDAVNTPVLGTTGHAEGAGALLKKISTIAKLIGKHPAVRGKFARVTPVSGHAANPFVAIGASTGGPLIVAKILAALPQTFGAGIVVIQHIDEEFAPGLAEWLADQTSLRVRLASEGDRPSAGTVLIADPKGHLLFTAGGTLSYCDEPKELPYCPSVDVFFHSVAGTHGGRGIAVLLTGMGKDGAEGLLALRNAGWHTIAQDQKTSIVYGMPKAAAELHAATEILAGDMIVAALLRKIIL